ncbi:MAG TPA: NADP oxidoreductase [Phycisphaerales bacterium]|nr:NADP oxidoreductase [Phycisphaerales bacterium]
MSVLDIDERIFELVEIIDFDRSPIVDFKDFTGRCAVGLVEGGCGNEENVEVLRSFRRNCEILISLGDCATMGGIPALRNLVPTEACLREAYLDGPSVHNPSGRIPNDVELPLLLDKVRPAHEVVRMDYFLPGCPPSADTIWAALTALLTDKPVELPYELIKYD